MRSRGAEVGAVAGVAAMTVAPGCSSRGVGSSLSLGDVFSMFRSPRRPPTPSSRRKPGSSSWGFGSSLSLGGFGSLFRSPRRLACYFSLLAQREVTKRKGTPIPRSPGILPCDCARRLRGSPTVHPCTDVELAGIHAGHPAGLFSAPSPRHRSPVSAHPARPRQGSLRSGVPGLLLFGSPAVAPRSGVGQRGKANCLRPWMAELFAGRWTASTAGNRLGEAHAARMPGCPVLWLLSFGQAKESNALAAEASGTGDRSRQERVTGQSHRSWIPAFAGMTAMRAHNSGCGSERSEHARNSCREPRRA